MQAPLRALIAAAVVALPAAALAEPPQGDEPAGEAQLAPRAKVTSRPEHAKPGELFEVTVEGEGLTAGTVKLGSSSAELFEVSPGKLRAYVAVPLSAAAGAKKLELDWEAGEDHGTAEATFTVDAATFSEHTLTVARKFTSPSAKDRAWARADRKAFVAAYKDVAFEPPLFKENFTNPRPSSELNAHFGDKRLFNGKLASQHEGLDLDGKTGDPIYAANDGVVKMVRPCWGSGNTVLVWHGAGLWTAYFHMSKFNVKQGQKVKKGELLGLVGKTGRVTGPHLHLMAKLNGVVFNPESLLTFPFFEGPVADLSFGAAPPAKTTADSAR